MVLTLTVLRWDLFYSLGTTTINAVTQSMKTALLTSIEVEVTQKRPDLKVVF